MLCKDGQARLPGVILQELSDLRARLEAWAHQVALALQKPVEIAPPPLELHGGAPGLGPSKAAAGRCMRAFDDKNSTR